CPGLSQSARLANDERSDCAERLRPRKHRLQNCFGTLQPGGGAGAAGCLESAVVGRLRHRAIDGAVTTVASAGTANASAGAASPGAGATGPGSAAAGGSESGAYNNHLANRRHRGVAD